MVDALLRHIREAFAPSEIAVSLYHRDVDVLASVLKSDPDWSLLPKDTPPAIRRLLRRCLEKDRKRRIADASDVRLEIEEAMAPHGAEFAPTAAVDSVPRRATWTIGALALGGLAWWLVRRKRLGKAALIDPSLFESKYFRLGISGQMMQQIALGGTMIALPIFLQMGLE